MAFKVKTKNRNPINTKQTLDATHHEIIEQFQQELLQIPLIEEQIADLDKQIAKINIQIKDIFNFEDDDLKKSLDAMFTKEELSKGLYDY